MGCVYSAEEALAVGEASRHYGDGKSAGRWTATYEGTANNESNPDNFSDGELEHLSQQPTAGCLQVHTLQWMVKLDRSALHGLLKSSNWSTTSMDTRKISRA